MRANAVLCRPQSCGWQGVCSILQPASRTGFQKHFTIWYYCASPFAFKLQIGLRICHTFSQSRKDSSSSFIATVFLHLIMCGCHVQWRHHRCGLRNLDIIFMTFKNPSFFYGRKWNYTVSKLSECLAFVSRTSWRIFTKFEMNIILQGLAETNKF